MAARCILLLSIALAAGAVSPNVSQTRCLTAGEVQNMVTAVKANAGGVFNQKLHDQLLKLRQKQESAVAEAVTQNKKEAALMQEMKKSRTNNATELCAVLKQFGWPTRALVGEDGADAALYLLRNSSAFELQVELMPVIIAASEKGEIEKRGLARYVDRLRIGSGLKQMFGTQATIRNGFLVLYPIEAEATVDQRRKQYELTPLRDYIRSLETIYQLPLIRATGTLTNEYSRGTRESVAKATATDVFSPTVADSDEVVRVETNLVSINVSVHTEKTNTQVAQLEEKDFRVLEDGRPQEISHFATTDVPFDLVLLLDVSGSTVGKRDVIRKSTKRFIEATRPIDRVAIVTFANQPQVISPLTDDRASLLASVNSIEGVGGTRVWDALKFTLADVVAPKNSNRRTAVVVITDGVDNALSSRSGGSVTLFSDLLETVRASNALIVPIYLDTEPSYDVNFFKRIYENARNTLRLLADESGGLYYRARDIEHLQGLYGLVIEDLGKIYSLGYRPDNQKHDGSWRQVEIQIPAHPELRARARPGYYAQ